MHLEETQVTSSSSEKLLGITIDSDLKFDRHISNLYNRVTKKNALWRVTGYMSLEKRRIVMKTLNYCRITVEVLSFNIDVTF